jgi:CRP-like cAMP-binding protein
MINHDAAERFMNAPLLADVAREAKLALLNAMDEQKARAGSVLLKQGQPNDHLTFLIDGTVELERTFRDNRKEVITILKAPAVFGTTSFFQPKPPTVTARAESDVWMLVLHHPQHDALRRDNPRAAEALAMAVVRTLSERFDLLDQHFTDFIAQHREVPASNVSEWSRFRSRLFEEHKATAP